MPKRVTAALIGLALACAGLPAAAADGHSAAAEPEACRVVRMSDPFWTDITATNGIAGTLLEGLGYQQKVENLSVPITYQALEGGKLDVFLGNWMPAQKNLVDPLLGGGKVDLIRPNLEHAKFTLAVPTYVAEAGVRDFADLAKFGDRFGRKIYGIEPAAPANQNIQRMLDAKDFGLTGWQLVESSEQGMLSQADRAIRRKDWIVFLAWEPHTMNTKYPLTYLSGGDRYFGPDFGSTTVNTLSRKGYAAQCPNAGRLFRQLSFTVALENEIMGDIPSGQQASGRAAATRYLKAHPDLLGPWLDGVTTIDGKDGLAAVRQKLGVGG